VFDSRSIARLLVIRPDRVGDVLVSSSCLPALRESLRETKIWFAAPAAMSPLYDSMETSLCVGFRPLQGDFTSLCPKAIWAQRRWLESGRYDCVLFLHPCPTLYAAAWLAGIPRRIGWTEKIWSRTLTLALPYHKQLGEKHEADYSFDLLSAIGVTPTAPLLPHVYLCPEHRTDLEAMTGGRLRSPYAVINPTAFSPVYRWKPERFAAVAKVIAEHLANRLPAPTQPDQDRHIILVGQDADDPSVTETAAAMQNLGVPFLSLAGRTHLGTMAWLLKEASLLVTRNTGLSHLAAAVNCPLVDLFHRSEPIYGPTRWSALHERKRTVLHHQSRRWWDTNPAYWKRGMDSIQVEEVTSACLQLLDGDQEA